MSEEWRKMSDKWRMKSDEWQVTSVEWQVTSDEWRMKSDKWRVSKLGVVYIPLCGIFIKSFVSKLLTKYDKSFYNLKNKSLV